MKFLTLLLAIIIITQFYACSNRYWHLNKVKVKQEETSQNLNKPEITSSYINPLCSNARFTKVGLPSVIDNQINAGNEKQTNFRFKTIKNKEAKKVSISNTPEKPLYEYNDLGKGKDKNKGRRNAVWILVFLMVVSFLIGGLADAYGIIFLLLFLALVLLWVSLKGLINDKKTSRKVLFGLGTLLALFVISLISYVGIEFLLYGGG